MTIILPIFLGLSAYYFSKFIRINAIFFYTLALLFISASMIYTFEFFTSLTSGLFGLSFLLVVMYTGIMKTGSTLKKQLSRVRKDYAVLGFLFLTPYAYSTIYNSLENATPLPIFGLLAYFLMIPLFITSFDFIKNKIKTSEWIQLHKLSYLVYLFMFLHIISVSSIVYLPYYYLLFAIYSIAKLQMRFGSHKLVKATTITIVIGSASLLLVSDITDYLQEPKDMIQENSFKDGTYIGYAKGYQNIDTIVRVIIHDDKITFVLVDACGCTPNTENGFYADAAYQIANDIRNDNTIEVDSIAGATKTSIAIKKAVIDALLPAIID